MSTPRKRAGIADSAGRAAFYPARIAARAWRGRIESAAEDVQSSTQQLADSLKALGAPETDSGEEVQSALDTLSTTLDTQTAQIKETAQGVTDIAGVPSAITEISTSLSALGTAFSSTLQTIEDADTKGELKSALEDAPECADVTS